MFAAFNFFRRQGATATHDPDQPAPMRGPVSGLARLRARGLQEFRAPIGADVPRYAPPGFPEPIWSDADLERPDPRRFSGGAGPKAGHVLPVDRRKAWQKKTVAVTFDRTGAICNYKR